MAKAQRSNLSWAGIRSLLAAAAFCLPVAALGVSAAIACEKTGPTPVSHPAHAALDTLFDKLRNAANEMEARQVENQIWQIWTTPNDPDLAARMDKVLAARRYGDFSTAIGVLDEMIAGWPDYAEAYNQRATIYFLMENYDASLADIEQTLSREPRHFGALAGRAIIHLKRGERALALENVVAALKVHPFVPEKGLFPELNQPATNI